MAPSNIVSENGNPPESQGGLGTSETDAVPNMTGGFVPSKSRRTNTNVSFSEDTAGDSSPRESVRLHRFLSRDSPQSTWSNASSVVPEPWKKRFVLSFGTI
jgi:hypothetical protein